MRLARKCISCKMKMHSARYICPFCAKRDYEPKWKCARGGAIGHFRAKMHFRAKNGNPLGAPYAFQTKMKMRTGAPDAFPGQGANAHGYRLHFQPKNENAIAAPNAFRTEMEMHLARYILPFLLQVDFRAQMQCACGGIHGHFRPECTFAPQ